MCLCFCHCGDLALFGVCVFITKLKLLSDPGSTNMGAVGRNDPHL